MSDQPPPYEEVAAENPALLEPSSTLVVHLQVWHYAMEGRSPTNNDGLAALFHNHNLQNWEVIPLEVDGVTGPSCQDQYVPVEVRFRHRIWAFNCPSEHLMADVRDLFFKAAPQFIYQFFIRIGSTPHNLNISPVGVPEEFLSRYTHAYILNRLGIRVNAFFVPRPVVTNNVQSWLRNAVNTTTDVLKILAAIVSLYLMYRRSQDQGNGNSQVDIQGGAQDADVLNVDVPQQLDELQRLFEQFRQLIGHDAVQPAGQIANVQAALNGASGPLDQYLRLANRMESRLTKLENNQDLSNQDLYELVQDTRNAALHLSTLKKKSLSLVSLLEKHHSEVINKYRSARAKWGFRGALGGAGIGIVTILCLWNPVGWAALGAYSGTVVGSVVGGVVGGAVGGAVAVITHSKCDAEREKAFGKKDRVRAFDLAIKALNESASQAREAVATVFCNQVMKKRLDDTLPEHHKRALLATLGVNVDAMSNCVYTQELICDRLRKFRERNNNLRISLERVLADVNFESQTAEQAA